MHQLLSVDTIRSNVVQDDWRLYNALVRTCKKYSLYYAKEQFIKTVSATMETYDRRRTPISIMLCPNKWCYPADGSVFDLSMGTVYITTNASSNIPIYYRETYNRYGKCYRALSITMGNELVIWYNDFSNPSYPTERNICETLAEGQVKKTFIVEGHMVTMYENDSGLNRINAPALIIEGLLHVYACDGVIIRIHHLTSEPAAVPPLMIPKWKVITAKYNDVPLNKIDYVTDYVTDCVTDYDTDCATNYATDCVTNYATDYDTDVKNYMFEICNRTNKLC